MIVFTAGLFALIVILSAIAWFSRVKTEKAARLVRMLIGGGSVLVGALLTMRGQAIIGGPISLYGLGMLGIAIRGQRPAQEGPGPEQSSRVRGSVGLSVEDAREILGVEDGATLEDIRYAHRQLMKKLHPDTGEGSAALARQVQEARDVLLASKTNS
jgi:hypothetical protein